MRHNAASCTARRVYSAALGGTKRRWGGAKHSHTGEEGRHDLGHPEACRGRDGLQRVEGHLTRAARCVCSAVEERASKLAIRLEQTADCIEKGPRRYFRCGKRASLLLATVSLRSHGSPPARAIASACPPASPTDCARRPPPSPASMSDPLGAASSDDEVEGLASPAENGDGAPHSSGGEEGLDAEVDDLFGDEDEAPA